MNRITDAEVLHLVQKAAEEASVAVGRRDERIREAKARGIPVTQLIAVTGLSKSRIYQILAE